MQPVIQVDHLAFSYGDNAVLKDISLVIHEGEFVGLIGPNGGGKTTLLKLLMGFLKPTIGSVSIYGHPPEKALSKISYVPQSLSFDKQFPISAFEVVLSGRLHCLPWHGQYSQEDRNLALEALEKVNLTTFGSKPFGSLSGGQAQRCLIARALVSDPKILLLDEPTASVDSKAEADIYDILNQLKGKMTIVMVTHDLQSVIDHVQQVYCIQGSCLALKPEEVCKHFAMGLYHPPLIQVNKPTQINPSKPK